MGVGNSETGVERPCFSNEKALDRNNLIASHVYRSTALPSPDSLSANCSKLGYNHAIFRSIFEANG